MNPETAPQAPRQLTKIEEEKRDAMESAFDALRPDFRNGVDTSILLDKVRTLQQLAGVENNYRMEQAFAKLAALLSLQKDLEVIHDEIERVYPEASEMLSNPRREQSKGGDEKYLVH